MELMGLDLRVPGKDSMVEMEPVKSAVPTKEIILLKVQKQKDNVVDWIQKVNGIARTYYWSDQTTAHFVL